MGQNARDFEYLFVSKQGGHFFCFLFASLVCVDHGREQQIVLLVKKNEGFAKRRNTKRVYFVLKRNFANHAFEASLNFNCVNVISAVLVQKVVFLGEILKDFTAFGEKLTFATGRSNIYA